MYMRKSKLFYLWYGELYHKQYYIYKICYKKIGKGFTNDREIIIWIHYRLRGQYEFQS